PPDKIDVQREIEKQTAEEDAALKRTVEEAIQEAHELEQRPGRLEVPMSAAPEQPAVSATPNGQSDQESQPNLTQ
ncbi:MAG TPA: hypothetical protein VFO20_14335, partial [Propionibacteriaceae bacterium]|nr:hypothetical protein [Propionibacteriaceae bacterium]